jgi:hypothetical protein
MAGIPWLNHCRPAAGDRHISEATQRSMDLLRCAIVTNRATLEQIKASGKNDSSMGESTATHSDEKGTNETSTQFQGEQSKNSQRALPLQDMSTWDAVLQNSYKELNQSALVSETLDSYIPESIMVARSASLKQSSTSKKPSVAEVGNIDTDTDNEIRILLTEWTNASQSNVDTQLENSRQQKRTALPGIPQWIQDR